MNKDAILINFSDRAAKQQVMTEVGRLSGLYEVMFKPRKLTRSLNQNAYYWAAIVTPFTEWLRENFGDSRIDKEQAHEMLKMKILGAQEKEINGEPLYIVPRSKTLTTEEFEEYIEKCSAWLSEFCDIVVVPCEAFYEHEAPPTRTKRKPLPLKTYTHREEPDF